MRQQIEEGRAQLSHLQAQTAAAVSTTPVTETLDSTADTEAAALSTAIETARRELVELDDAVLLQQVGIYEYHHPLENADAYKERLADLRERIKEPSGPRTRSSPLTASPTTTPWLKAAR